MAKLKFSEVKEEITNAGWFLLSDEYKNLDTELRMLCPLKHEIFTTLKKWRRKQECPICKEKEDRTLEQGRVAPKTNERRTLAIDQATYNTGWAIFDDKKLVQSGCLRVEGEQVHERIAKVRYWLCSMVSLWSPDVVILEDIQLQGYGQAKGASRSIQNGITTFKILAQLQGVLINYLVESNLPFHIAYSTQWKSHCGIKAKTSADQKRAAQLYVQKKFGITADSDRADAICLGDFCVNVSLENETMLRW